MVDKNLDLRNSHTFTLDLKLPSGEEFSGTFTIHRPTVKERIRIGIIEARELEGLVNVDVFTSNLTHFVATFDVIVDSAPVWFKPRELRDVEVLQGVFEKYTDFLRTFQGKPEGEPKEPSSGTTD